MGGVDEDGLISGLKEEELITNEEMDQLVKEVRAVSCSPLPSVMGGVFDFRRVSRTPSLAPEAHVRARGRPPRRVLFAEHRASIDRPL